MRLIATAVVVLVAGSLCVSAAEHGLANVRIPRGVKADAIVQHHSLIPPLLEEYWSAGLHHWDFGGAAAVTDEYVRLTPNKQSREGYLWNDQPSHLNSWTVFLGFRLHSPSSLGGDGFAMWYTDGAKTEGGPLFGHPEKPRGLGIIFDTFDNNGLKDNPTVSVIVGDGTETFRTDNDLQDQRLGGCSFNFRNSDKNDIIQAIIEYSGDSLKILLASHTQKLACATISPLSLPDGNYFGLTSHTGHLADNNDIHHFIVTAPKEDRLRDEQEMAKNAPGAKRNGQYVPPDQKKESAANMFSPFDHHAEREEKEKHKAR